MLRNKPADLTDGCWTATGERVHETATSGTGTCNTLYPSFADSRMAAGAPLRNDVLKCNLKPLGFGDYPVTLRRRSRPGCERSSPAACATRRKSRGLSSTGRSSAWLDYGG